MASYRLMVRARELGFVHASVAHIKGNYKLALYGRFHNITLGTQEVQALKTLEYWCKENKNGN